MTQTQSQPESETQPTSKISVWAALTKYSAHVLWHEWTHAVGLDPLWGRRVYQRALDLGTVPENEVEIFRVGARNAPLLYGMIPGKSWSYLWRDLVYDLAPVVVYMVLLFWGADIFPALEPWLSSLLFSLAVPLSFFVWITWDLFYTRVRRVRELAAAYEVATGEPY